MIWSEMMERMHPNEVLLECAFNKIEPIDDSLLQCTWLVKAIRGESDKDIRSMIREREYPKQNKIDVEEIMRKFDELDKPAKEIRKHH